MEIMEMTELSCTEALEWAGQWWQAFGWFGLAYGVEHHFQQYFNYVPTVSFNGGGNHQPVASH
jgi:hypothetical protein